MNDVFCADANKGYLQVGSVRYEMPDTAAAAAFYVAARDASGLGASEFPPAPIVNASGATMAHVSYNGRIWTPALWASIGGRP